ncbi:hypothetical protein L3556_09230 [Candidatus Synechococcus calcipolaris G9]|uniref:Uncharacterized protein n=1 Tax=Candidatus Synechococcus calcipolaris G9 TaxID=1497997 RepID=A0ABT6EZS0_9SYNE|nr:hypothetical protein [Candidatus Synechococcus calcipolaris]MDG2991106.1 hypothetical protein [Candidatus Synechococcus calcipolaris G9]
MFAAYQNFIENHGVTLSSPAWDRVKQSIDHTHWDEPSTPLDLNNCGVLALIEADGADNDLNRGMYLELAISAFMEDAKLDHASSIHYRDFDYDTSIQPPYRWETGPS